jgi:hypothetical protein
MPPAPCCHQPGEISLPFAVKNVDLTGRAPRLSELPRRNALSKENSHLSVDRLTLPMNRPRPRTDKKRKSAQNQKSALPICRNGTS